MINRILIALMIATLLLVPLIPANTRGEGLDNMLDITPHWKEFSRDRNHNGIDDIIDERTNDDISIIVVYDHHPTDRDVKNIESLGLKVWYRAKYIDALLVGHASREQIDVIRFIEGVSMVEIDPEMRPMLDVSAKAIKARPTNEAEDGVKYHDVWEELGFNGTGINIAILDTGANDHWNSWHESLDDMDDDLLTLFDFKFIAGWDYEIMSGGTAVNPRDSGLTGHGTHCAGVALGTGGAGHGYSGIAPGARLVDVKVMTDVGAGGIPLPAIEWCIDNKDTDWENDGPANDGICT